MTSPTSTAAMTASDRSRRPWRWAGSLVAITFFAAACTTDGPAGTASAPSSPSTSGSSTPPSPAPSSTASSARPSSAEAPADGVTPIRVVIGDQTFDAELDDNPTARALADQLPVAISLDDLHGLEKTGRLPQALTTGGVPAGADPEPNEIGYYAPGQDLVFYYGDVGYFTGIVRSGRFTSDIAAIADQPDGFRATLARA